MQLNAVLRNIIIWGIYLLPLTPLIVATSMFFPFITGKAYFFRVIAEVLFGVWVVLAARDASYRPKFSWILGAFALFLGIIALADLFGENLERSFWSNYERMEGLITHIHLFVYFLVAISVLNTEKLWERFFHISLGVSLFIALYGIMQLAGELVINQGGVRIDGTLGNATYLAVYMLFHFFFALFWYVRKSQSALFDARPIIISGIVGFTIFALWSFIRIGNPNIALGPYEKAILVFSVLALGGLWYAFINFKNSLWVGRLLYAVCALLALGVLYYTATRGAILGLFCGVVLVAFLTLLFEKQWTIARKGALAFLLGLIVLVGGFLAVRDTDFVRQSQTLSRLAHITLDDAESRLLIWGMSIEGFKERPILGWGQENFNIVFNKYYDPKMYKQEPWFDRAHGVFFDWLVAGGILGLLAYLSLFISTLYCLWFPRGNHSPFLPWERNILTGLFAAYFFQNIFVFDQLISYLFFFSTLAFIHISITEKRSEGVVAAKKEREKKPPALSQNDVVFGHVIISLMIIGMPFLIYALNMNSYLQNRTLLHAIAPQQGGAEKNLEYFKKAFAYGAFGSVEAGEQLSQYTIGIGGAPTISNELKTEFLNLAVSEMKKQIEKVPNDARYRLFLASLYTHYGFSDRAVNELNEALLVSPKKQTLHYALANAYLKGGELEKAYEATRTAFEEETTNVEARRYYAAAAIYAGHNDVADELLQGIEVPSDPVFINALVKQGRFAEVVKIWEQKVANDSNNAQARLSLAAGYVGMGEIEKAVEQLKKVIETNPEFKERGEQLINDIRSGRAPQ